MDVLFYNNKNEVVSIYTTNDLEFEKDNILNIKGEKKNYKVVQIEKYRKLGSGQVILELKKIS